MTAARLFSPFLPYFSALSKETEGRRPKHRRPLMMSCCEDSNSFVQLTNKSGAKAQQKLHPQEPNIKHIQQTGSNVMPPLRGSGQLADEFGYLDNEVTFG